MTQLSPLLNAGVSRRRYRVTLLWPNGDGAADFAIDLAPNRTLNEIEWQATSSVTLSRAIIYHLGTPIAEYEFSEVVLYAGESISLTLNSIPLQVEVGAVRISAPTNEHAFRADNRRCDLCDETITTGVWVDDGTRFWFYCSWQCRLSDSRPDLSYRMNLLDPGRAHAWRQSE